MRRDLRPYYLKDLYVKFQNFYVNHFLRPQFEALGNDFTFMQPWCVEVFGPLVYLGNHVTVMAASDNKVRFSVWSNKEDAEGIFVGDAVLVSPGVRISASKKITIGEGSMLAANAYLTDSDWHDVYNRVSFGGAEPITLGKNVWVCDNAMIGKGVTVGDNSVVAARSVVIDDVPANVIVAGNPARVVKELDPEKDIYNRADWFRDRKDLYTGFAAMDRQMMAGNTLWGWIRHRLAPRRGE